ncbi:hypothetical protein Sfulv_35010 [Streptomyces fulvorobeus]|uniref:Uncharacterized protein n=1 Tax=Streptomyces fulvorobeus TaxID=284028 RepID=A0A7J0C852_9ACTN|nr:hypothetical protein Sfulv_35010 [Streptomyces fulvorobeus]
MNGTNGVRLSAAGAAVLTVAAGLGVRAAADGDVAKYAGDALYTVLIHTLVVVAAPGSGHRWRPGSRWPSAGRWSSRN